jgi:hypothetical protein
MGIICIAPCSILKTTTLTMVSQSFKTTVVLIVLLSNGNTYTGNENLHIYDEQIYARRWVLFVLHHAQS